jgi:hypothetical protein
LAASRFAKRWRESFFNLGGENGHGAGFTVAFCAPRFATYLGVNLMSLGTILLIILIIVLLGGFSGFGGGPFYGTGYYGGGGLGLIVVIVLILVLLGKL